MTIVKTTYAVRPFEATDEDYTTINTIFNTAFPEYAHLASQMKFRDDTRSKKYPFNREMLMQDGEVVAYGEYFQDDFAYHPQKFNWGVMAYPSADIASLLAFYEERVLAQLADEDLIALTTSAREDKIERVAHLEAHGYVRVMRYQQSQLEVDKFNFERYTDKVQQTKDSGIEIITAKQLSEEKPHEWHSILHELDWVLVQDVPLPDPPQKLSLEEHIKIAFENPGFLPEAYFIAREGNDYVGTSTLWKDLMNPERLWTGLTGVKRSHRRRGVATALKVTAISYAKQSSVKNILTNNEENNPMYQLNVELGFTPLPAWLDFEKALKED